MHFLHFIRCFHFIHVMFCLISHLINFIQVNHFMSFHFIPFQLMFTSFDSFVCSFILFIQFTVYFISVRSSQSASQSVVSQLISVMSRCLISCYYILPSVPSSIPSLVAHPTGTLPIGCPFFKTHAFLRNFRPSLWAGTICKCHSYPGCPRYS